MVLTHTYLEEKFWQLLSLSVLHQFLQLVVLVAIVNHNCKWQLVHWYKMFLTIQVKGCLTVFSFKVGFKRIERTSGINSKTMKHSPSKKRRQQIIASWHLII